MLISSMPARASLPLAVALALSALAQPALAQNRGAGTDNSCPKAAISGPGGITLSDVSGSPLTASTYTLDSAGSRIGTGGATYQWTQRVIKGKPGTLRNAGSAVATFVAPDVDAAGSDIEVTLSVTSCGSTDSAKIKFTVTDGNPATPAPNNPPTARGSASPSSVFEGDTAQLDASGSTDPDPNTTLTYRWTQLSGTPVTLENADTKVASFTAPQVTAPQALEFQLEVSDGSLSHTTKVPANIVWTNRAPVARASCPLKVNEGGGITLDGSASSDSDNGIASYRWEQTVGLPVAPRVEGVDWNSPVVTFPAPQLGYQQVGDMPFRLTVTDAAGLVSISDCTVLVKDVTLPSISVPSDIVAEATSPAGAPVDYTVTASDLVDGAFPGVNTNDFFVCSPAPGSVFALDGNTPVECSARDSAGNTANAGFSVQVVDTTAPDILVPTSFALEATGPLTTVDFIATSSDIVDGDGVATCTPAAGSPFGLGTTRVGCTATDRHDNSAERAFEVSVHDTTPPAFSAVTDLTFEADSPAGFIAVYTAPTASDLVDGPVDVSCSPASGSTLGLGTHAVTCTASDRRDVPNTATTGFSITVRDTTPPVIAPRGNEVVEATGPNGAFVFYSLPPVTDAVSPDLTATCSPASATVFALGTTTVTCSAVDGAGNAASPTTFEVTVQDTTAPVLTSVADLVAEATSADGAAVSFTVPTASDAVDGAPGVACDAAPGSVFALGTTTVTCSATDRAGNVGLTSFQVTVQDTTAPTLSGLADVRALAASASQAVVNYPQPTAADLVDGSRPVTCSPVSGSTFNVGVTTVTCSAVDSRGNRATGSFTVTVSYDFTGFFQPVDNLPAINVVKAGSAVPVKFSLGGNQGLAILQAGFPKSGAVSCSATTGAEVEETVTAGSSSLQYDATANQYIYVWKTDRAWTGCRVLNVTLRDGTTKSAMFRFR